MDPDAASEDPRESRGLGLAIPLSTIVLLGSLVLVFLYGIFTKASEPRMEVAKLPAAEAPSPGREVSDLEAYLRQRPILPEPPGGGGASAGASAGSEAAAPGKVPSASPRQGAPASALTEARRHFAAREYYAAARAWRDWAATVPEGSWTVQVAAVRLDRAGAVGGLDALGGREGAFVLPAGALPGGLSPVCLGIYPSAESAGRAIETLPPLPGVTGRPIAKPIRSLLTGG